MQVDPSSHYVFSKISMGLFLFFLLEVLLTSSMTETSSNSCGSVVEGNSFSQTSQTFDTVPDVSDACCVVLGDELHTPSTEHLETNTPVPHVSRICVSLASVRMSRNIETALSK